MRFIIGTHSFLLDVTLNKEWEIKQLNVLNHGYHFGIAFGDGQIVGADSTRQHLVAFKDNRYDASPGEVKSELLAYQQASQDFTLLSKTDLDHSWGDVHQIAYTEHGLYTTNTKSNSLVYQDHAKHIKHNYHFENKQEDWNHVNSVFPMGNHVLAILHNRARQESELAVLYHDPSQGFQLESRIPLWHLGCHNVFLDEQYLIYNASQAHSVVIADWRRGIIVKTIPFEGWHTKGMTVTNDYVIVGTAEHAPRSRRATTRGQLEVIDRHSWQKIASVDLNLPTLPHPVGNINEFRCISGEELAQSNSEQVITDIASLRFTYDNGHTMALLLKTRLLYPWRRLRAKYYDYRLGKL